MEDWWQHLKWWISKGSEKLVHRCPPDSRSYSDLGPPLLHHYYYIIYTFIYMICFSHSFSRGFWLAFSGQGTNKRELDIYLTMWMFLLILAWRLRWAPPLPVTVTQSRPLLFAVFPTTPLSWTMFSQPSYGNSSNHLHGKATWGKCWVLF